MYDVGGGFSCTSGRCRTAEPSTEVFTLTVGTVGKTVQQRARQASRVLAAVLDAKNEADVRSCPCAFVGSSSSHRRWCKARRTCP